jgi:O-antigen/teichoic acid export membrane protein
MRVRALLGASATVTAATVVVNLLSYAVVGAGTRVLGAERYGELAALLGLLLVGAVPAGTVQVVVARRVAAGEHGGLGAAAVRAAALVTVVAAVAVPVAHTVLHISLGALGLLVLALPAVTLGGAPMGAAQGLRLFGKLALTTTIVGVGRVGGMLGGLAVGGTAVGAMAGLVAGSAAGVAGAMAAAGGQVRGTLTEPGGVRAPLAEVGHACVTMLGLAAIMTADVLLAKRYLPAVDAGLYGAGAVVTKAALWLPYAVTMIALPRLAVAAHRKDTLRTSIMVLAALGVLEIVGVLALGKSLFPLAVGKEYTPVSGWLWLFAAEGAALAIAQLVIMSRIAATDRLVPALLWVGLLAEVGMVALFHGSIGTILTVGTVTACLVTGVGLLLPARENRELALNSPVP